MKRSGCPSFVFSVIVHPEQEFGKKPTSRRNNRTFMVIHRVWVADSVKYHTKPHKILHVLLHRPAIRCTHSNAALPYIQMD